MKGSGESESKGKERVRMFFISKGGEGEELLKRGEEQQKQSTTTTSHRLQTEMEVVVVQMEIGACVHCGRLSLSWWDLHCRQESVIIKPHARKSVAATLALSSPLVLLLLPTKSVIPWRAWLLLLLLFQLIRQVIYAELHMHASDPKWTEEGRQLMGCKGKGAWLAAIAVGKNGNNY